MKVTDSFYNKSDIVVKPKEVVNKMSATSFLIFDDLINLKNNQELYTPIYEKKSSYTEIEGEALKVLTETQYQELLKEHQKNNVEYTRNLNKYKCCKCNIF